GGRSLAPSSADRSSATSGDACGTGWAAVWLNMLPHTQRVPASTVALPSSQPPARYDVILRLTDSDCALEASPSSIVCSLCCTTPSLFSKDTATRSDFDFASVSAGTLTATVFCASFDLRSASSGEMSFFGDFGVVCV